MYPPWKQGGREGVRVPDLAGLAGAVLHPPAGQGAGAADQEQGQGRGPLPHRLQEGGLDHHAVRRVAQAEQGVEGVRGQAAGLEPADEQGEAGPPPAHRQGTQPLRHWRRCVRRPRPLTLFVL